MLSGQACLRNSCSSRESRGLPALGHHPAGRTTLKIQILRLARLEKIGWQCRKWQWAVESHSQPVLLELDPAGVFVVQSFPYMYPKEKTHMECS